MRAAVAGPADAGIFLVGRTILGPPVERSSLEGLAGASGMMRPTGDKVFIGSYSWLVRIGSELSH